MSVKVEDLEVDLVRRNFNLCLFQLIARLVKKLNSNFREAEDSAQWSNIHRRQRYLNNLISSVRTVNCNFFSRFHIRAI